MTMFLVNPRKGRTRGTKRKKRRSAKQIAATKKMLAARKRALAGKKKKRKAPTTSNRSPVMARKAKRRSTSRKRRRSTKRRAGASVRLVRRGTTVYRSNPRRRRRRSGYHRNPGIIAMVKQGAIDAGLTLAGGAAARTVSGFVPLSDDGLIGVGKGTLVAVGVGIAARKFLGGDKARFVTAGAMQVPLKKLITTFMPSAGGFLGDYDNMGAYLPPNVTGAEPGVNGYMQDVGMGEMYEGVGAYVEAY